MTIQLLSQITGQLGGAAGQTSSQIRGPTAFRLNILDDAINTPWFLSPSPFKKTFRSGKSGMTG
jgi:hypothetical protein